MHLTYHRRIQVPKKGRHCWPLTISTLTPPMDDKYYCNRLITFHCHSSRKFRIHLASIAVASSDLFCIFAPPYSMTCIRLWFWIFQSDKYMWITCPFPIDCHLLDQNRFTNVPVIRDQKSTWHSWVLPPNTPLLRIFEISLFYKCRSCWGEWNAVWILKIDR